MSSRHKKAYLFIISRTDCSESRLWSLFTKKYPENVISELNALLYSLRISSTSVFSICTMRSLEPLPNILTEWYSRSMSSGVREHISDTLAPVAKSISRMAMSRRQILSE